MQELKSILPMVASGRTKLIEHGALLSLGSMSVPLVDGGEILFSRRHRHGGHRGGVKAKVCSPHGNISYD